ncbi:unnamed protein product [Adineta steineri]|uniref:Uncharacterized protein n=1 Tax=Adineta steineri TaxID=433720 RepID=A0A815UMS6_9BILA|nr:unnamed protein product [Adineta steineri]CAF4212445.1 unnamed protein product [Adineta steineri]
MLNVKIQTFENCLYLLDGRFNQLHTLIVDLANVHRPYKILNQGDLPNLKCFSFSHHLGTSLYNELILPLLYRMSNLEQLSLYLRISFRQTFIDGNDLKQNILNRMSRLNQFTFYICSSMIIHNQMILPSTEDIQRTFIHFPINPIVSYVDYFPEAKRCQCHIYSYPSPVDYYDEITNNFPGGLFTNVRHVSLFDEEHPFEHDFFVQIQKSFPFIERLGVFNHKPQNSKPSYQSNTNQSLDVIKYSFLNVLNIINAHDDYIEQFLFDTKTHFQNDIILYIKYECLERVTNNFTRDITRRNCAKIKTLRLDDAGAYFADDPHKSHNYTALERTNKTHVMFYSKVTLDKESVQGLASKRLVAVSKGFHSVFSIF